MTSKTSYNNPKACNSFIFENIRQRGWLFAVSMILFLLCQTVYTTLNIDNFIASSGIEYLESYQLNFPQLLNGANNAFLGILIVLLAITCGITGFSYLHQPKSVDFFHSFPLRREHWFAISYISGFLIFLIPYTISSILTLVVGGAKGVLASTNLMASIFAILSGILCFLVIYHTTLVAMMLTGKVVVGTLASAVLIVYGAMVTDLFFGLLSSFFKTYYTPFRRAMNYFGGFFEVRNITSYLSPIGLYNQLLNGNPLTYEGDKMVFHASKSLLTFLIIIVFLFFSWMLARILYKNRSLEVAGTALAYPKIASALKVLIVVPTTLFVGLYSESFFYNRQNDWMFITCIIVSVLLCGIVEFIYTQDLSQVFKRKLASLVSIGSVLIILSLLHFDAFGYDSWLPKKESLESMALYSDSYSEYFFYPNSEETLDLTSHERALYYTLYNKDTQITDFSPIYELAKEGIENVENGITSDQLYLNEYRDYTSIIIRFNLNSSSSKYRAYTVKRESLLNCIEKLCEQESYRKELFPIFHINADDLKSIDYSDFLATTFLTLSKEEQANLFHAYQKDLLETPISVLQEHEPIGEFTLSLTESPLTENYYENYVSMLSSLYIYDTFKHTLAELKKHNLKTFTELKPEDIIQMVHITYESTPDSALDSDVATAITGQELRLLITDPAEKQKLLDRVSYYPFGIVGSKSYSDDSLEILLNDELSMIHFNLLPSK